ncbi:MAG: shikimate kinase AroK [Pseudomonadales bacterium]|jgi:shikimate kinase|nr:shikimate kinase AroK [Pseudomonadales bacterium]MDG1938101.1 shikimate kinase AroK [Pseudomonadales bacterium]MDG2036076.1 shikimate kinase AroK [Pseudomonadales bacterium]
MTSLKKIFLVGPMGAGKTTIGRHLATELSLPFIDTDHEIEERCGANIPWIFDVEGEEGFRLREHKVLDDICQSSPAVIATGGGIIMRDDNRALLKEHGVAVYLHATVKQQLTRTGKDRSRPLLNKGDPKTVLTDLMAIREPLYREVAKSVFPTDNKSPRATASAIAKAVNEILQSE